MYITIDIGGTKTRIALFKDLEYPVEKNRIELRTQDDYEREKEEILSGIKDLIAKPKAIGISITGVLNENKTGVKDAISLRTWKGENFKDWLEKETDSQVDMENDMVAAGLGEAVYGRHGLNNFLFVIWGTGIGGAYLDRTSEGWVSEQSEFGQQVVDWDKNITLENLVAGREAEKFYGKKLEELNKQDWKKIEKLLSLGLYNTLCVKYAQNIIFGGGVSAKQEHRLKSFEKSINERFWEKVQIMPSSIGENAGLLGALALIKNKG